MEAARPRTPRPQTGARANGGSRSSPPSSSLTALATAWSGYQASLWDGIQSSNYTQASAARTEASQNHTEANQFRLGDLSVFENFVDATLDGDTELADFYRQRFRDEFEPACAGVDRPRPVHQPGCPAEPVGDARVPAR